jgi:formamidopyrimidine-DNA glycosylase
MPELPDVVVYCEAVAERVAGHVLERVQLLNPFVLRTALPPIDAASGRRVERVERSGKRIVLALAGDLHLVIHLMIAGRLRWLAADARPPARISLALLQFDNGRLVLTEAGSKRRASLHLVEGELGLAQFQMGGLEVLDADLTAFATRLTLENHTLKRALTDPHLFSGIGNAYSDEILHRAKVSPIAHTRKLTAEAIAQLYTAAREVLLEWTARLRTQAAGAFPEKVTAFRPGMAVHGRYGKPCPVCGAPVQRIVYAENECNYCARCQTGGTLLADRSLSRLLHKSWPRSIDELG